MAQNMLGKIQQHEVRSFYEKKTTVKDTPCLSTVKDTPCPSTLRIRNTCDTKSVEPTFFFCEEPAGLTCLHEASTFDIDSRVRKCAQDLQDTKLLAKLAQGDMIASEVKYHAKCLVGLYNKVSRVDTRGDSDDVDDHLHGIAFAQLVSYMEEFGKEEDTAPVFELAGLVGLYTTRLKQLGVSVDNRIHSTRLKMRLLASFPDLTAHTEGRDILLTFDQHLGGALRKACDHDGEALYLARAAQIVRQEIFDRKFSFNGSFQKGCQQEAIPNSLLALVNMIQEGPNIVHQTQLGTSPSTSSAHSISQLLMFNSVKHTRSANATS